MSSNVSTIISELSGLLAPQLAEPRDTAPETDLISDLALESVQIMEFMVDVEDHYDIAISLEALAEIRTLQQLADLIVAMLDNR
ncbi:MAG: phosphopantetheine-binding protein [Gammaproteobacteria bacterium]|nr:phosphopantetheine-binding protein [Gammaproteobacteria bacterium]